MRHRIIPVLLVDNRALVKTKKFKNKYYIGDPVNALKLYNEFEVDELIILDISARKMNKPPDYQFLSDLVSEAFMPIGYGGGIQNIEQMEKLFSLGIEKISINTPTLTDYTLIENCSKRFGSQSIICSIDIKKNIFGKKSVYNHTKRKCFKIDIPQHCQNLEAAGAGEILFSNVDHDGMLVGYDLETLTTILEVVNTPVVVCGGAKGLDCFAKAARLGADAAAGSLFCFSKGSGGVLINYPSQKQLKTLLTF